MHIVKPYYSDTHFGRVQDSCNHFIGLINLCTWTTIGHVFYFDLKVYTAEAEKKGGYVRFLQHREKKKYRDLQRKCSTNFISDQILTGVMLSCMIHIMYNF